MTQENGAETRLRVDRAEKRGLGESQQWERGRRRTEQDGRERETEVKTQRQRQRGEMAREADKEVGDQSRDRETVGIIM